MARCGMFSEKQMVAEVWAATTELTPQGSNLLKITWG